jgi:hypothetical protein
MRYICRELKWHGYDQKCREAVEHDLNLDFLGQSRYTSKPLYEEIFDVLIRSERVLQTDSECQFGNRSAVLPSTSLNCVFLREQEMYWSWNFKSRTNFVFSNCEVGCGPGGSRSDSSSRAARLRGRPES